jgi:hypothetical protein
VHIQASAPLDHDLQLRLLARVATNRRPEAYQPEV